MIEHLPILQVVIPLLGAPLCLLIKGQRLLWVFAVLVCSLALAISCQLLMQVNDHGVLSYALGGWAPPWGIEYRIDFLNGLLLLIVSGMATLVLLGGYESIGAELPQQKHNVFYAAFMLCFAGLLGIAATGDAFNIFVFLEISSLASYTLIALGRDRHALWSSYQYLIMGTIGATFILIAVGLMYMVTGTLNMADLANRLPSVLESNTILAAFAFFVVGVCLKLALFPLHLWLPNAYAYAPSIVTAFLAASSTKVAVYLLIRFTFDVFGIEFSVTHIPLRTIFLSLGLAGVFVASVVAIYQTNVKRLFAYSSVAQIGYMIIGFSIGNVTGITATLLHLFNHALMKGALFMALAGVVYRLGSVELKQLAGLRFAMPWTVAALVAGGLSLIGVPLTVGFVSKWYLVAAALEEGMVWLAVLIVLGSLLAVVYVWRLVEATCFGNAQRESVPVKEAPISLLLVVWILVAANLYFGIATEIPVGIAEAAANALYGGQP